MTYTRLKSMVNNVRISGVEILLLAILLAFGIPMLLLIPPGAGYDEEDHLVRVWEMSAFSFIPGQIPPQEMKYPKIFRDFSYRQRVSGIIDADFRQEYYDASLYQFGSVSRDIDTKSVYSPALLLPQAVFMRYFGRPAHLSAITIFRMCRFASLLSYLILIWLAIRLIPFGKWILLVLAVTPMALFQASTISPDAISNGLGFLFIAGCLNLARSKEINWRECGALVLLILLLFLAKLNLVPLVLLPFLLITPARFTKNGTYPFLLAMTVLLFAVEIAGWNMVASRNLAPLMANDANLTAQLRHILGAPFIFLQTVIRDLITNGSVYFQGWINGYGYYHWTPPQLVSFFYILSLASATLIEPAPHADHRKFRIAFILTFVACYFATVLSIYTTFTPVGADEVLGVQGRYFIPLVLPLVLALGSIPWLKKETVLSQNWIIVFLSIALSLNILGIMLAFYVPCGTTYYQTGLCYQPLYKDFSPESHLSEPISNEVFVTQDVQVACNGLAELRVLLTPSSIENNTATRFVLEDPASNQNLLDTSATNDLILSETWHKLHFDPDWHSAGKKYILKIFSVDTPPGLGLRLRYSQQPQSELGSLYENGQLLQEHIVLQYGCITGLRKIWLTGKP
ncbi:MAG: DUF2142 domain-containing protein [Chloroflexota bacterium]|nr:DUF2142 domain-containing protein [Chloroflexota bacterium]